MHISSKARFAAFFLATLTVSACSSGTIRFEAPMAIPLAKYDTVRIDVSSNVPDTSEEQLTLEGLIGGGLTESQAFRHVAGGVMAPGKPSDLVVEVTILEIHRVYGVVRVLVGGFAGWASVKLDVVLKEGATGNSLRRATVDGRSSAGTIFAGTTVQALERAAGQVVEFVVDEARSNTSGLTPP